MSYLIYLKLRRGITQLLRYPKTIRHENLGKVFQISSSPILDENQDVQFLVHIIKDVTEQKRIEVNLRETEDRFKKITDTIPEIRFWKLFNPKKYEEALQSSYEMLQMVIENIPQYIIWKDIDLSYLGCNDNYAKLIEIK